MLCPADSDTLHGFLVFAHPIPPVRHHTDPDSQRQLVIDAFTGVG